MTSGSVELTHVALHATQLFAGTLLGRLHETLELRLCDRVDSCLRVLADVIQIGENGRGLLGKRVEVKWNTIATGRYLSLR